MSITSTQKNPLVTARIATGRYITSSTAAAFDIELGFTPRYVKVVNLGSSGLATLEWFEGMADASALLEITDGTKSVDTTTGITVSATGFTVGLNTDVNIINEQLSWLVIG